MGMRGCRPTLNGLASMGTMGGWKGGDIAGKGAMGTLLTGMEGGAAGEYWPVIVPVVGLMAGDCGLLADAEVGRERPQGAKCSMPGLKDWRPGSSRRNMPVLPMTRSPDGSGKVCPMVSRPSVG